MMPAQQFPELPMGLVAAQLISVVHRLKPQVAGRTFGHEA